MIAIKSTLESNALDLFKLQEDVTNGKISGDYQSSIINMYDRLLDAYGQGAHAAVISSLMNTLMSSGYFIDYKAITRTKTINEILKDDEVPS